MSTGKGTSEGSGVNVSEEIRGFHRVSSHVPSMWRTSNGSLRSGQRKVEVTNHNLDHGAPEYEFLMISDGSRTSFRRSERDMNDQNSLISVFKVVDGVATIKGLYSINLCHQRAKEIAYTANTHKWIVELQALSERVRTRRRH
jgi:hypothetical protein